jgi:hypothetical protein
MKFFTPDLLTECQSSDPDVAEAAAVRWQRRADAYRKRLRELQHRLPLGVRKLLRAITLHDASLLSVNLATVGGRTHFFLSFRLADGVGRAGVQIRYDLVKPLKVLWHDPKVSEDERLFALYSEFDILADGTLTHAILMTRGVEFRVRFNNLVITSFTHVLAPGLGKSDTQSLLEMASPHA